MMALKSLGINCTIDNMFASLRLPSGWVVEQGLTLAQLFSVITKLSGSSNPAQVLAPGITAECYHFDSCNADFNDFVSFLEQTLDGSDDAVIIANFSTKVARDYPDGGGHFSLIAGYDPGTDQVTIADVHPAKYGAEWTCPARRMFDSMVDKDSGIARSRGLIRLATKYASFCNSLDQCRMAVSFRDLMFHEEEQAWLSRWGDLPIECFESHLNMGGLSSIGLCLSGFLSLDDFLDLCLPNYVGTDYLAWSLGLSITELLGTLYTPRAVTRLTRRALDLLEVNLSANSIMANLQTVDTLYHWLEARIGPKHDAVALALLDLNDACGVAMMNFSTNAEASKLHHGSQHWCVLTIVKDTDTVVIADPKGMLMGRLWKCPVSRLREGMIRAEKDPGRVVVVARKSAAP
jgi:Phytochelatin synthase